MLAESRLQLGFMIAYRVLLHFETVTDLEQNLRQVAGQLPTSASDGVAEPLECRLR